MISNNSIFDRIGPIEAILFQRYAKLMLAVADEQLCYEEMTQRVVDLTDIWRIFGKHLVKRILDVVEEKIRGQKLPEHFAG